MNDWIEKECQGQCVKCGSENLDYGVSTIEDEYIYYDYECQNCGCTGEEHYGLVYDMNRTKTNKH
tara:strand:+ start:903 stop:1097 length:195 start_codon:yes stop_codon:yes gene_type:complete